MASKASKLIPRGVLLFDILVEGTNPNNVATRANLNQWIGKAGLPFSAALDSVDPQPTMETFFGVPRDQFVIVDLKTMKFIDILNADPTGAIAEVEGLLGSPGSSDGGSPDM